MRDCDLTFMQLSRRSTVLLREVMSLMLSQGQLRKRRRAMNMKMRLLTLALLPALAVPALALEPSNRATTPAVVDQHSHKDVAPTEMIGKRVLGRYQEFLGTIMAVDEGKQSADMKTTTGTTLALSLDMLVVDGDHVSAPAISRGDVIAMTRKGGAPDIREVKGSVTK
jgi:hypothetical protein